MNDSDAKKNLVSMDEKRAALLDNCTRALCGDSTVDASLLDEATGGRYSSMEKQDGESIKTLLLALRWLALPPDKKVRKRRVAKKNADGSPAKKPGRPKKAKNNGAGTKPPSPVTTTTTTEQPSA
jgi:hypothetical protein